jgi:hypothetical protein
VLSIDARGIVDNPFELDIEFLPWSGLGMTDSDIAAFVSYVRSKLSPLSDGSVGLPPGIQFPLVGPGSPVPMLTFQADAGQVTLSVGVVAEAQSVPHPPTWVLLGCALGTVTGWGCVLRRRPVPASGHRRSRRGSGATADDMTGRHDCLYRMSLVRVFEPLHPCASALTEPRAN